jgi:hypothetical protein
VTVRAIVVLSAVALVLAICAAPIGAATDRSSGSGYFKTPSGNIVCFWVAGRDADPPLVVCGVKSKLKAWLLPEPRALEDVLT